MKYEKDLSIGKKYLNLIDKHIYNTETDKFGIITGIKVSGLGISIKAYYGKIDSDSLVFFEDFTKGKLKFVIFRGMDLSNKMQEKYENEIMESVKLAFDKEFTEDMILYCDDEECKKNKEEKEQEEIKCIFGKLINLEKLSAEIFYDDYTALELYKKYSENAISELEMLYGVCNHLCKEVKRLKDDNLNYFIDKYNQEQAEFLVEYVSRKKEVAKKSKKIISNKGTLFELLDKMMEE